MTARRKVRLIFVGAGALALVIPATAVAMSAGPPLPFTGAAKSVPVNDRRVLTVQRPIVRTAAARGCDKLFTVEMGEGAANLIYSGHGQVSEHDLEVLGYIERCQINPAAQGFVRGYDANQARMEQARTTAERVAAASSASASGPAASGASATHQSGGGGGWAIPSSVVQCESGGRDLPPNSAGASGYYQIIPSTWQAYGGGQYAASAYQATAQQQATVASRIWSGGAGAGQWVCAGG